MSDLNLPTPVGFPHFHYQDGDLFVEQVKVADLAREHGTPLYIYSLAALKAAYQAYLDGIGGRNALVCYGMKANSNLAVLKTFADLGSGFDIVSGGELQRVLAIGGDPGKVVFSGVGKHRDEIQLALEAGVKCFNVESTSELERLSTIAVALGKTARVSLRVNPDVDPKTHPYISTGLKENKFGIDIALAPAVYQHARSLPGLNIVGVDCHIGSQITEATPFLDALDKLLELLDELKQLDIDIKHIDIGGGLGIQYDNETPLLPITLLSQVFERLDRRGYGHCQIVMEPGRSLVGNAGLLVTEIQYLKPTAAKNFVIVDAAMTDLLRPTLYDAYHGVLTVTPRPGSTTQYDVVGPVCESGDWLAKDRALNVEEGDLLAIESAGAYAMVMASNYNTRPRAAEVMVDGTRAQQVRARETVESLFALESPLR